VNRRHKLPTYLRPRSPHGAIDDVARCFTVHHHHHHHHHRRRHKQAYTTGEKQKTGNRLTASFPGQPGQAGTKEVKPLDFNEARDDGMAAPPYPLHDFKALYKCCIIIIIIIISWIMCKSCAPRCRQIIKPAPRHSSFYRPDVLPNAKPVVYRQKLKKEKKNLKMNNSRAFQSRIQIILACLIQFCSTIVKYANYDVQICEYSRLEAVRTY